MSDASTNDAFSSGAAAYHAGKQPDDNPFQPDTKEYAEWAKGFRDAYEERVDETGPNPDEE